jgi:predicted AAA+ superfamily ATPase
MYKRILTLYIQDLARKYPIVTLLGPRQSGKQRLLKLLFGIKKMRRRGPLLL